MSQEGALSKRGEATRQRILDSAENVFAELGYAAARLEDVAQRVGIRRASMVYYFRNKQELYQAVEARIFTALEALTLQRADTLPSPREQLIAIADSWLDFMVARPTAARLILRNTADVYPGGGDPVQFSGQVLEDWDRALRAAHSGLIPHQFMHLIGGGILHYVCTANLLGERRTYDPADPTTLEAFRRLLHGTIDAHLRPAGEHP